MATSDSEDFESADEGTHDVNMIKKERKKRLSSRRSSNYSDCAQDLDTETKNPTKNTSKAIDNVSTTDGWDDFDIEENEKPIAEDKIKESNKTKTTVIENKNTKKAKDQSQPDVKKIQKEDKGWDDFDDWDDDKSKCPNDTQIQKTETWGKDFGIKSDKSMGSSNTLESSKLSVKKPEEDEKGWDDFDNWGDEADNTVINNKNNSEAQTQNIKSVADRLSASGTESKSKGWGWGGWGVDSLLNTATAGISSITNHVSQSISTVLETSIGAPDPEELARKNKLESEILKDATKDKTVDEAVADELTNSKDNDLLSRSTDDGAFQLGSLLSGVTKFVETTGTKVLAGGLDTLETIGKKTMEVLQEGDPGLAKKRAMLGLDSRDKIVLSQVLREAKTRADEEDRIREEKREAKQVHYETLFDDFEGLVHLEALEMLSKQVTMRIEDQLRNADTDKRQEIKETLQQVAELCEMPDEDEDDDCEPSGSPEAFQERLQEATQDLGLKLQFQPLVKQYSEIINWLNNCDEQQTDKMVYKKAVSALAEATALCVELYHKTAEMLLVKSRRSTADEADALTQLTVVLTRHVSDLATKFTEKLNILPNGNKEQINTYITNVFLEAGNSSSYIQNAFQLELPILQIGAA